MSEIKYVKMINIETKEVVYHIAGSPSRFIEGKEFIEVKRNTEDKLKFHILKTSVRKVN